MPRSNKASPSTRDSRPRIVLPADAKAALARVPGALVAWDALSYTHRREHVEAITEAKKPETRARRIAKLVERLSGSEPSRQPTVSGRPAVAKMGITAGERVLVLEGDGQTMALFNELPEGATVSRRAGRGGFDVVVLFAVSAEVLATRLDDAVRSIRVGGSLWVAFPKQSSGRATTLTRDLGWESSERDDLKRITLIALDDAWSAFRFRRVT